MGITVRQLGRTRPMARRPQQKFAWPVKQKRVIRVASPALLRAAQPTV